MLKWKKNRLTLLGEKDMKRGDAGKVENVNAVLHGNLEARAR